MSGMGYGSGAERISVDPERCGGRPCIRGMRIRVSDVLDLLPSGLTPAEILSEMPDLEPEDVVAALRFGSAAVAVPPGFHRACPSDPEQPPPQRAPTPPLPERGG